MQQFSLTFSVVIFVMLISFITGCGDNDDELINDNYLPIKVGNSWTFIDPEYPRDPGTISITGTTKLNNGKTVFIAATDGKEEGYLSRAANDLVLFHQAINDLRGELIYNPPIKVGTTWQSNKGAAEVVAQETVSTPAGIFQNCFRINVRVVDDDDYYSIWLAKNVGPVKLSEVDASDGGIEGTIVLEKFNAR